MDGNYYILLCIFLSYLTLEIQQIRILPENRFSRWCPYLRQFCLFCLDGRLFYMPLSLSCFLACLHAWQCVVYCEALFFGFCFGWGLYIQLFRHFFACVHGYSVLGLEFSAQTTTNFIIQPCSWKPIFPFGVPTCLSGRPVEEVQSRIDSLIQNNWIDRRTRLGSQISRRSAQKSKRRNH